MTNLTWVWVPLRFWRSFLQFRLAALTLHLWESGAGDCVLRSKTCQNKQFSQQIKHAAKPGALNQTNIERYRDWDTTGYCGGWGGEYCRCCRRVRVPIFLQRMVAGAGAGDGDRSCNDEVNICHEMSRGVTHPQLPPD